MKRILPWAALALALGGGVYAVDPSLLTGDASRVHSGAHPLGAPDDAVFTQLDRLVQMDAVPENQGAKGSALTQLIDAILVASRPSALLATVAEHFRDNGCVNPGSASEAQLLGALAAKLPLDVVQRQFVVEVLLDAATHSAPTLPAPSGDGLETRPDVAALVDAIQTGGEAHYAPRAPAPLTGPAAMEACVDTALAFAHQLASRGLSEPAVVHETAMKAMQTLPPGHRASEAIAKTAILAQNSPDPRPLLELAGRPGIDRDLKIDLCRQAVSRGAAPQDVQNALPSNDSALEACLVSAGDPDAIRAAATKSPDLLLRAHAIAKYPIDADPAAFQAVFKTHVVSTTEETKSLREQHAWALRMAEVASKQEDTKPLIDAISPLELEMKTVKASGADESASTKLVNDGAAQALEAPALSASLEKMVATFKNRPREADAAKVDRLPSSKGSHCDAVLTPGPAQAQIDAFLQGIKTHATLCFQPGTYTGPVELRAEGIRLESLEPKGASFESGLLIYGPKCQVVGFDVSGPVVIGGSAREVALVGNRLGNHVVSLATGLGMHDNEQLTSFVTETPLGLIDPKHSVSRAEVASLLVGADEIRDAAEPRAVQKETPR